MTVPVQLKTLADLDQVLAQAADRPVLVFKHSTTCPISAAAYQQWQAFLARPEAEACVPVWVRVIEERPVSLAFAERTGVVHQSPQAVLLRQGRPAWHGSHWRITADALTAAVRGT